MDALANQFAVIFSYPRVIGTLLTGIFVSLIIPAVREWLKDRKARKNLLILIYEDIKQRVDSLRLSCPKFEEAVRRAEREEGYEPCIFEKEGQLIT